MKPALRVALLVTDWLFMFYWAIMSAHALRWIEIPKHYLYANADDPIVSAWNWSFFPLDIAFSVTGLLAVRAAHRGLLVWRPLALISLILTMVAGGMSVSYWTLLREFDPAWFLPNLALLIWPLFFLPGLIKSMG